MASVFELVQVGLVRTPTASVLFGIQPNLLQITRIDVSISCVCKCLSFNPAIVYSLGDRKCLRE